MPETLDIAIVGAGPAGFSAAIEAARCGARVAVYDENIKPGGQLFKQIHKFFGSARHLAGIRGTNIGQKLVEDAANAGVECTSGASVLGVFPGPRIAMTLEDKAAMVISARKILLATGATENAIYFPGWTLPGVMGAGAAQTILNLYRVLPGRRILMVGSGNVRNSVTGPGSDSQTVEIGYVEGANRCGVARKGGGGIFATGFPGRNGGGGGTEARRLRCS